MKKYLLHIALFFGIVAVVDLGFGKTCEWLQSHAKGGRMKSVRQTAMMQESDIVVMGSSRAHHHYVPAIFSDSLGVTAYNAGVDGNGIVLATGLYDLMVKRYTPKVIIYDVEPAFDINVYAEDGNNTRYIGWLRPYFTDPDVRQIVTRVDPTERFKNISRMFRYNSKIVDLLKDQMVMSDYTKDGYAPLGGEMTKEPEKRNESGISIQDTLKLDMMEEFIAAMSKSDTRLIMVASPKYGAVSSEVFSPVKALCEQYGVEFWDYYCAPEFQKMEYFKEPVHLNDAGARAFTAHIAEILNNE